MKSLSALLALAALAATSALAQMSQPMVDENPTKISDNTALEMLNTPPAGSPAPCDTTASPIPESMCFPSGCPH